MKKMVLVLFYCSTYLLSIAQNTAKSKAAMNELLNMTDSSEKTKSYFDITLGVGNRSLSVNNNSVNASQALINKLYYTPSIGYYHKSGFGISISPYITLQNGNLKNYQTAVTPSFDYESTKISTGISFTKFITDKASYSLNSTYQNDLYGYIQYNKSFIQPILSLGYSTGIYNDISFDTLFGPINNRIIAIRRDSTKNEVKDFSVSFGIEHRFEFDSIFSKNGTLSFIPQLVLNAGSEKFTSTIINSRRVAKATKNNRLKSLTQTDNATFSAQSIALSLTAEYNIGNFIITPNLYIDYYLPTTTEKKISNLFSISVGYSIY